MSGFKKDARFYLAYIKSTNVSDNDLEKIESKFNLAYDWYRIESGTYILYTSKNASEWYSRIEKIFLKRPHIFVCALDTSDRQGWMAKGFWDWVKEKKAPDT